MADSSDRKESERAELADSTRRWMAAGVVLLFLFVGVFPVYRIYEPARRAEAREDMNGFLADAGGALYETDCAGCHGDSGRGGIAPALGARNFLESVDDEQMRQLISLGVPGTEMVAYSIGYGGPLTSQEIKAIATYLRSLEEDSVTNPNWRTPLADSSLSGQDLYTMACARCHGIDRAGIEDLGPDLSSTAFALEESDEWLIDRITNGKDDMPRFGGVLTAEQIISIVAYLRGVPPSAIGTTTTTTPGGDGGGSSTTVDDADDEVLALGKEIFDVTAGGEGCASCHGFDGAGTGEGPNILGSSKSAISTAMGGGVPDMDDIELTSEELEAVYQYLRTLSNP